MLSGSITKGLLTISIPVMVMNVVQSMFNILDMTILKSFDTDGMAVGAVGACGSLITLITGLVIGISAGANVVVAGYIGGRNQKSANRTVGTAITFSAKSAYTSSIRRASSNASSRVACAVCPSCHRNSDVRKKRRVRISQRTTLAHWLHRMGRSRYD